MAELAKSLPEIVVSQRLTLRRPIIEDVDAMVANANNWAVVGPTAVLPFPYLPAHAEHFITDSVAHPDRCHYAITLTGFGQLMGVIGFKFSAGVPPEIGYWLGETHWGKGYVSEAVTALCRAAAEIGPVAIRARVLANNAGSVRVLEKAGFVLVERTQSVVERHLGKPLLILEWQAP